MPIRLGGTVLFFTLLLGAWPGAAWAGNHTSGFAPITITEVRFLDFGGCDLVAGATFTVAAAESPGVTGCSGSNSGKFQVTGEPSKKVIITIPATVNTTNGTDTLTVTTSVFPTGANIKLDASGNLIVYVGGTFTIPAGGLGTSGLFLASITLNVVY